MPTIGPDTVRERRRSRARGHCRRRRPRADRRPRRDASPRPTSTGCSLWGQALPPSRGCLQCAPSPDSHGGIREPALQLFLVAGEHSGDALGGKLIEALRAQSERRS